MPIEVICPSCNQRLRVPDKAAGKKVKCPKCQGVIPVPESMAEVAEQVSGTADVGAGEQAGQSWYLKTDDGEDYGPVSRNELNQWAAEGRLNADCQVLKEGGDQWQWATDLYPELDPSQAAGSAGAQAGEPGVAESELSDKRRITAALLALICLGPWGVHRFYLGYTRLGIIQIVVTVLTCGAGGCWGFVEGILILLGKIDTDAQGRKLRD